MKYAKHIKWTYQRNYRFLIIFREDIKPNFDFFTVINENLSSLGPVGLNKNDSLDMAKIINFFEDVVHS